MAIGPTEIGIETGTEITMAIETEITETDRIDKEIAMSCDKTAIWIGRFDLMAGRPERS